MACERLAASYVNHLIMKGAEGAEGVIIPCMGPGYEKCGEAASAVLRRVYPQHKMVSGNEFWVQAPAVPEAPKASKGPKASAVLVLSGQSKHLRHCLRNNPIWYLHIFLLWVSCLPQPATMCICMRWHIHLPSSLCVYQSSATSLSYLPPVCAGSRGCPARHSMLWVT